MEVNEWVMGVAVLGDAFGRLPWNSSIEHERTLEADMNYKKFLTYQMTHNSYLNGKLEYNINKIIITP